MAYYTLKAVNKKIAKALDCKDFELVKGEGYMYFVYDHDGFFTTRSEMTPSLNDLTQDQWVEIALDFQKEVQAEISQMLM